MSGTTIGMSTYMIEMAVTPSLRAALGGDWNVPRFSTDAAGKINSYKVDC
jgi:hypothetical protein